MTNPANPLAPPAIVLAGRGPGAVHPVDGDGAPPVLLPLAGAAVLSYPLRWLEAGGVSSVVVVVAGDAPADKVRAWLKAAPPHRVPVRVVAVPDDAPAAAALAAGLAALPAAGDDAPVVVAPGDLVTDAPLAAAVLRHFVDGAEATVLLAGAKGGGGGGAAAAGKPGRAPAGVDYTAVSPTGDLLLLAPAASKDDVRRELRVPRGALASGAGVTVRCDAAATGAAVVARGALAAALARRPRAASLTRELLPSMVRGQWRAAGGAAAAATPAAAGGATPDRAAAASPAPPAAAPTPSPRRPVKAFTAPPDTVALRATRGAAAFLDAARDVAAAGARLLPPSTDPVAESVQFGARATVSAGCVAGPAVILGDKAAVKRSVLGAHVRLGRGARVVGCALLDGVVVDEGASLQGCVVGRGARVGAGASLRDCFVGPDYDVPPNADERDAVLSHARSRGSVDSAR